LNYTRVWHLVQVPMYITLRSKNNQLENES